MSDEEFYSLLSSKVEKLVDEDGDSGYKLNPPASKTELAALERSIPYAIPDQLVLALLHANGEPQLDNPQGILGGDYWLSTEALVEQFQFHEDQLVHSFGDDASVWQDCKRVKQGKLWRKEWMPISWGYDGRVLMIDTDPPSHGIQGQILLAEHIDLRFGIVANSLRELLEHGLSCRDPISSWPFIP